MIVITTSLLLTLVSLTCLTFTLSGTVGRNAHRAAVRASAFSIANSALELEFAQWYSICSSGTTLTPGAASFANITLPTAAMFPNVANFTATTGTTNGSNYTVSNYSITPVNAMLAPTAGPTTVTARLPSQNFVPYLATVDVTVQELEPVTVKLSEVFQVSYNSPWNYAIFYGPNDLEVNPSPTMSINGPVHSNSPIYSGAGGGQVTYDGPVDSSKTVNTGKDPSDPSSRGAPTAPIYQPGYPVSSSPNQWPLGINPLLLNPTGSNPNALSYHELIDPPTAGYSDPFSPPGQQSQRYYDLADYVVTLSNPTNDVTKPPTVTVTGYGGVAVSSSVYNVFAKMAGATVSGSNTSQALTAGTTSFEDDRENATMEATDMDVGVLTTAVASGVISNNPDNNSGLVIYVEDTRTATSTKQPAVRLDDGYTLPSDGLTVVSPNPVYVQGDYNTGGSSTSKPATDSGTPNSSESSTVGSYWEPAAIIADAVSILSNNWKDSNSTAGVSSRNATATTVNAGIMAGNVPDSSGSYSGGVENFPRFLENWSGIWFTYYGSMVNLYTSKQATGPWGAASYNPPNRFWNYDPHFRTRPPPGTFATPCFAKQQWFIRQ